MANIIIYGNTGAGKTWLTKKIAAQTAATPIHLDSVFWAPGNFNIKRSSDDVHRLLAQAKSKSPWIMEGIYGDIIESSLKECDQLIWLDIDITDCIDNLVQRGEKSNYSLIKWAESYHSRTGNSSRSFHHKLFKSYKGAKIQLTSKTAIDRFVGSL